MQEVLVIDIIIQAGNDLPAEIAAKIEFSGRLINRANPAKHRYLQEEHHD